MPIMIRSLLPLPIPAPFFFQAEDGIRDGHVTGVQTCALPILCHVSRIEPFELLTYHQYPNTVSIHIPSEPEELAWTPTFCTSPASLAATARSWPTTGSHFASVPGRWWACWATTAPARPRSYPRSSGC